MVCGSGANHGPKLLLSSGLNNSIPLHAAPSRLHGAATTVTKLPRRELAHFELVHIAPFDPAVLVGPRRLPTVPKPRNSPRCKISHQTMHREASPISRGNLPTIGLNSEQLAIRRARCWRPLPFRGRGTLPGHANFSKDAAALMAAVLVSSQGREFETLIRWGLRTRGLPSFGFQEGRRRCTLWDEVSDCRQ